VSVIFAGGGPASVRAARAASATTPIVFATGADPVSEGLVAGLNRPGSNITGVAVLSEELTAKRLELLHEVVPAVTTIRKRGGVAATGGDAGYRLHRWKS
jgi:putative tryptophan/tyrosine transport system substrate-binding protein